MQATEGIILVLMGPSGAGKSALGRALSADIGLPFLEGDDFHSAHNRARMAAGTALTDEDRWPWLEALANAAKLTAEAQGGAIISCSALRRAYREKLQAVAGRRLLFVFMKAERELLQHRMRERQDHFMPASLLETQLATLEVPTEDECCVTLDADKNLNRLVAEVSGIISGIRLISVQACT